MKTRLALYDDVTHELCDVIDIIVVIPFAIYMYDVWWPFRCSLLTDPPSDFVGINEDCDLGDVEEGV